MVCKVGKLFKWEMSHRLPFHKGQCKYVHGHSYKMLVELEGQANENGIVIDYYDINQVVAPLLDKIDHAFLCDENDRQMIEFLNENNFKIFLTPGFTTSENMTLFFMNLLLPEFAKFDNLHSLMLRVYETEDAYAELKRELR